MSTETVAILRAILNQIEDCIAKAKATIEPRVVPMEVDHTWYAMPETERMAYERMAQGPKEEDPKRKVVKYWPQLVSLGTLYARVQQYLNDVKGAGNGQGN